MLYTSFLNLPSTHAQDILGSPTTHKICLVVSTASPQSG
jgi:hypothetical protein